MKLTGAQIVIECLVEQGVNTVFGYPGGAILNIYDELYKNSDRITHILTAHEQGASHAADGYARSTGNVGVVMASNNEFKIGINCRIPLDEHIKVVEDKALEAAQKYNYTVKVLGSSKRHYVDPNGKLVQTLLKVYQEVTGDYENKPFTIGGGTYAREIGNAVAYGPVFVGREDVCHIANEYMFYDDFIQAIEIYAKAIYELTK